MVAVHELDCGGGVSDGTGVVQRRVRRARAVDLLVTAQFASLPGAWLMKRDSFPAYVASAFSSLFSPYT